MRQFYLSAWLLVGILCFSTIVFSQTGWKEVSEGAIQKNLFAGRYKPETYKIFQLNEDAVVADLKKAPNHKTVQARSSSFILTIPGSDGQPQRFKVVESEVMDPALAAKYPDIKTYTGQGIDDPTATAHFDYSPRGFHAMVLSDQQKTMYIDPVDRAGKYYVVFSRKDFVNYKTDFHCLTPATAQNASLDLPALPVGTGRGADDGKLRTYRLALACTGEYAQYFLDGTEANDVARKGKVMSAMVTLMARTNGIYERDFGIHMNLIANNDQIIYLNAGTDPWGTEWNIKTQQTLDDVIGSANYDIGHLVDRGPDNGNAGCIGCVCKPWNGSTNINTFVGKGGGFTSHQTPEGDPFVVDYTTHEMGHQFGASHTFTFSNEGTVNTGSASQMEPGSGSTIMGYAGITGSATDVQQHSDDYFHAISVQQITDYIKGTVGGGCAVVTTTGNATPTANAGSNYTIPKSTPFALTGTATDADAADVLSYTWEQFDVGSEATTIPDPTESEGVLFRSRPYSTSPTRVFPILASILDGTNGNNWEQLPGVTRTLTFRLMVRDNHTGGGNTRDDDMSVTVAASGPFAVTSPNTAVSWGSGTSQTITWSVNNTNSAPVNCANVKISLSTDGGLTFPIVLAASTPNDGTETVTLPATTSTTARIKVEAVGNIFFDISNVNFTITGPEFNFSNPAAASITCGQTSSGITLAVNSTLGFSTPVTLTASNVPAGTNITFGSNPVVPGNNTTVTLNNTNVLSPGTYAITITGTAGVMVKTRVLNYVMEAQPAPVVNTPPQSVSSCVNSATTFSVTASNAVSYQWQVSTDGGTNYSAAPGTNTGTGYTIAATTLTMNNYRYRVVVNGTCSQVVTSAAATLTVISPVVITDDADDITICETGNVSFTVAGTSSIPVIYQWQVSTNGGTSYTTIANGGEYSGATTATLAVSNVNSGMNNNIYRARLSNATCTTPVPTNTVDPAVLTVNARPTVGLTASPYINLLPGQSTTISAVINPAPTGFNISWRRDDQLLPGITGTSYLVDSVEVGDYKVRIVNPTTGCNNESNVLTIGTTASTNLFIFPSPNDGRFTVSYYNSSGTAGKQTLAIYDSRGQLVYNAQLNVNGPYTLHDINLRGRAKGVYYAVIGDGSGKKITEGKVMIY